MYANDARPTETELLELKEKMYSALKKTASNNA